MRSGACTWEGDGRWREDEGSMQQEENPSEERETVQKARRKDLEDTRIGSDGRGRV